MFVEIFIPSSKRFSEVRIDGIPQRNLVDYSVDLSGDLPVVTLKVRPDKLRVHGEMKVIRQEVPGNA